LRRSGLSPQVRRGGCGAKAGEEQFEVPEKVWFRRRRSFERRLFFSAKKRRRNPGLSRLSVWML